MITTLKQTFVYLDVLLLGNSLGYWLTFAIALIVGLLFILLLRRLLTGKLKKLAERTTTCLDDALVEALRKTYLSILVFPLAESLSGLLILPEKLDFGLHLASTAAIFLQVGIWLSHFAGDLSRNAKQKSLEKNSSATTSLSAVSFISKLFIWSAILLLALDNLGVNVSTMVAGLGVGGIAVALAVQNILGDLFASLSIIIDKPFEIGDFIIVDNYMGTVENVGLKTTRIRSLSGEQIIFSNSDLLGSRVRNYKRMYERRVVFAFGVLYQTPADLVEKIPEWVSQIIMRLDNARFDRAHFLKFGESSLDFEVVYYVTQSDYTIYMNIQQSINLALMRKFAENRVEFAYPTRTVYIAEDR